MPDRFEVDPSDRIINKTCEAIDEVIKGITPQMVRRYALLQAAVTLFTSPHRSGEQDADGLLGAISVAEQILAEIERRENA